MATRHRDNGVGTPTLRVSVNDSSVPAVDREPIDSLLRQASRLRLTAPELALVFGERGAALAEAAGAEDQWARAEGLAVAAHVRLGRRASVAGRAVVALRAAEASGQYDLAGQLRTDLALCARSVGAPWTGLAALRPILDDEAITGRSRSAALLQLVGCLGPLGRRDVLDRALVEAEELIASSDGDEKERTLLRASVCGRRAAHLRRHSDIEAAISSARDGLALVEELDRADDGVQLRVRLGLELVCALLDRGDRAEAHDVADDLLATPGRATSAGPLAWLRLAIATRVLVPAGAAEAAGRSLRSALYDADRHGLCAITSRLWLELSHVEESIGRPEEALTCLHRARKEEHAYGRVRRQALSLLIGEFGRGEQHVLDVPGALGIGRGHATGDMSRPAQARDGEPEGRKAKFGVARHARRAADVDDAEESTRRDGLGAESESMAEPSATESAAPREQAIPEHASSTAAVSAEPGGTSRAAEVAGDEAQPASHATSSVRPPATTGADAGRDAALSASHVAVDVPTTSGAEGDQTLSSSAADADAAFLIGSATPTASESATIAAPEAESTADRPDFDLAAASTASMEPAGTSEIASERALDERGAGRDSDETPPPSTMDSRTKWLLDDVHGEDAAQSPESSSARADVLDGSDVDDSDDADDVDGTEDGTVLRSESGASSARSVLRRLGVTVGSGGRRRAPELSEDESVAAAPAATATDSDAVGLDIQHRATGRSGRSSADWPGSGPDIPARSDVAEWPAADDTELADGGAVPAADDTVPAAGGAVLAADGTVPAADDAVPAADDGDAVPAADDGDAVRAADDTNPRAAAIPPREATDGKMSSDHQWPDSDENRPAVEMDSVLAVFANWADGGSVDDSGPMAAGARRRGIPGPTNGRRINGDDTVTGRHRGEA